MRTRLYVTKRDVKLCFEVELCERCISHAVGRNVEAVMAVIVRTVCVWGNEGKLVEVIV